MSKYAKKAKKGRVARFATPDEVISFAPITERYFGMSKAEAVLDCRHTELKSWRVLGYELAEPHATLSAIVKRGRTPTEKLIKKLNNTYGCHIVYHPKTVTVAPLPCGCAPTGTRCKVHQPAPKYAPHPVMRLSKIRRILQSPYKDS
jgi:hypothetical protein